MTIKRLDLRKFFKLVLMTNLIYLNRYGHISAVMDRNLEDIGAARTARILPDYLLSI